MSYFTYTTADLETARQEALDEVLNLLVSTSLEPLTTKGTYKDGYKEALKKLKHKIESLKGE